jgi:hypothetical protein
MFLEARPLGGTLENSGGLVRTDGPRLAELVQPGCRRQLDPGKHCPESSRFSPGKATCVVAPLELTVVGRPEGARASVSPRRLLVWQSSRPS